jgi:hypothetical protein
MDSRNVLTSATELSGETIQFQPPTESQPKSKAVALKVIPILLVYQTTSSSGDVTETSIQTLEHKST